MRSSKTLQIRIICVNMNNTFEISVFGLKSFCLSLVCMFDLHVDERERSTDGIRVTRKIV